MIMGFDPRRLQILVELDARGSVAAVAEMMYVSASAVSQQLGQLEREIGTKLTEKAGRRLVLTEAGRRLAGLARKLQGDLELIVAETEITREVLVADIRLAAIESLLWEVVPMALRIMKSSHPGVNVDCHEVDPEYSVDGVSSGSYDLAVIDAYEAPFVLADPGLSALKVGSDPILIALPAEHPLAHRDSLRMADLVDETWVSPATTSTLTQYQSQMCKRHGQFVPRVRHRTNSFSVAQKLIAAGQGVAMIPRFAAIDEPGLVFRRTEDGNFFRDIFLVTRKSSHPRPSLSALSRAVLRAEQEVALKLRR